MKKHNEELLEQLIRCAADEWLDDMADEPLPETKENLTFSSGFEAWADNLVRREEKRERRRNAFLNLKKAGKRVAIVACILIAICSLAAFTIPPVRIALTNYLIDSNDKYYDMSLGGNGNNSGSVSVLGFVPDGFKPVSVTENEDTIFVVLENDIHQTIVFERFGGKINFTLDNEDVSVEKVSIGGLDGYYSAKNGENKLMFNDDQYSYTILSVLDKETMIKMAESIKK